MNVLIGDIGNTITKFCMVDKNSFRLKKINYFNSEKISSRKFLKNEIKKIIENKSYSKIALFSSVVPKHQITIKKFLKKNYKISLKEIKDKK